VAVVPPSSQVRSTSDVVSVLVADDDPLVRLALRDALADHEQISVTGEAVDGEQTIELARRDQPDVVLLDNEIPGIDALTVIRRIRADSPNIQVLLLSSAPDDELSLMGLRAGAAGFLVKGVTVEALGRSLLSVSRGEAAISRALSLEILRRVREAPEIGSGLRPVRSSLTSREWQVLDLLCDGLSTDMIAAELDLSTETVRSHTGRLFAKLGAHSRSEAVAAARRLRAGEPVSDDVVLDESGEPRISKLRRDDER